MKYILLQTILVLLLLSIFGVADFNLREQNNDTVFRIENLPVIVFSQDWHLLRKLSQDLSNDPLVKELSTSRNVEILGKMIMEYELPAADRIIDIDQLPNMLQFSLQGASASSANYEELKTKITESGDDLMMIAQDEKYQRLFSFQERNRFFRLLLFVGTLIIVFMAALILRIASLKEENFFWKLYYRSGGRRNRFIYYLFQSLTASLLPVVGFGLVLYLIEKHLGYTYFLDINSWLIIIGVLILSIPLAWLVTTKEY
jgi:hypothetical protein